VPVTCTVRRASVHDLPTVADLFEQYLRFYEVTATRERAEGFLRERLGGGDAVILLAEMAGADVGMAQCFPTLSSLDLAPIWVLSDLFVTPQARGDGVGRALLREVVRLAGAAGAAAVTLETAHENTAAQGLYESEGFVLDTVYRVYAKPVASAG
jgi:ribosomal protein S18 acetylase RimI-like enzyme